MGKDLRVDPAEVRMAADHVDAAADGLRNDHGVAQERIGTAKAGWIGTSGDALSKVAAKWEEDSTRHYNELVAHVEGFKSAAAQYVGTDNQESTDIDNATSNLGSMGL
jgi:WXG100 family type VII secretion target